jgi:phage gpG-like protein
MARAAFEKGAKIQRWERNLDNPSAALKQIGALMVAESQRAFREQQFGEEGWERRGIPNVFGIISDFAQGRAEPPQRRFEHRPALHDTGRLAASIAFKLLGTKVVEVGSNLDYAAPLHHGGEVESETVTEQVQRRLGRWLKGQGSEWKDELGFLLRDVYTGKKQTMEVPARPIVGITKQTRADVLEAVQEKIMEVK